MCLHTVRPKDTKTSRAWRIEQFIVGPCLKNPLMPPKLSTNPFNRKGEGQCVSCYKLVSGRSFVPEVWSMAQGVPHKPSPK